MKQTVEEAANNYLQKILESSDFEINFEEDNYDAGARDAILDVTERAYIAGAEWQKEQAIEALSSVLDNWVHGGDADCIIAEFEEKLK